MKLPSFPLSLKRKKTGWERVEQGEIYHRTDPINFSPIREGRDPTDELLFSKADYFSSEALAENFSRMQAIQRKMFRWQAENDAPTKIYNTDIKKWFVFYDYVNKSLEIEYCYDCIDAFMVLFSSKEKAEEFASVFKNELIWLFTEFKSRMD